MPKTPRRSPTKEKRSWWLSDEAVLYLHALAEQEGLDTPHFLESISRKLASERLSDTQREHIQTEAHQRAAKRQHAAQHADTSPVSP